MSEQTQGRPAPAPRTDGGMTAREDITVEGAPGNRLAPWLLSGTDEEVIEALMRRSAGDVACLFFPTPVNVADPIRRTYYEGQPPRQQRLLAELLCRLKPATPAQPAGAVPDGLREAFSRYDAALEKHERAIKAHEAAAADIDASSGSEEVGRSIATLRAMYAAAAEVEGARVDFVETFRTLLTPEHQP
jgi:hypothetical protein